MLGEPSELVKRDGQLLQKRLSVEFLYVPFGHGRQSLDLWNVPSGQERHSEEPRLANVPRGQGVHDLAPKTEVAVPILQKRHRPGLCAPK